MGAVPVAGCFFFNDTATTEIYTLSLHDALPISCAHDKLISAHGLPNTRRLEGKPLQKAHRQRTFPSRKGQAHRHPRTTNRFHTEPGTVQQSLPAVKRVEMKMRTVEKASLVLRETAHQHIPAKIEMAAIGKRS